MKYAESDDATDLTTLEFYGNPDSTQAKTSRRVEVYLDGSVSSPVLSDTLEPDYVLEKNEFLSSVDGTSIVFNPRASHQLSGSTSETNNLLTFDLGEDSTLCATPGNHVILVLEPSAPTSTAGKKSALEKHKAELIAEIRKNDVAPLQAAYEKKLVAARAKIKAEIEAPAAHAATIKGLDDYTIDGAGAYADTASGGKTIQAFRQERDAALAALGDATGSGLKKNLKGAQKALADAERALTDEKTRVLIQSLKSDGTGNSLESALYRDAKSKLDVNSQAVWQTDKQELTKAQERSGQLDATRKTFFRNTSVNCTSAQLKKMEALVNEAKNWSKLNDPKKLCQDSTSIEILDNLKGSYSKSIKNLCLGYEKQYEAFEKIRKDKSKKDTPQANGSLRFAQEAATALKEQLKIKASFLSNNRSKMFSAFKDYEDVSNQLTALIQKEKTSKEAYLSVLKAKIEELFDSHCKMSGKCGNVQWQELENAKNKVAQTQAAHDLKVDEQKAAQDALDGFLKAVQKDNNHPFITTHLNTNNSGAAEGQLKKEWNALQAASAKDDAAIETEAQAIFKDWDSEKETGGKTVMNTTITPNVAEEIKNKAVPTTVIKSTTADSAQKRTLQLWTLGEVLEKIKVLATPP